MKQCPKCNRGYPDESLNFCLDDGAWLASDLQSEENPTQRLPASFDAAYASSHSGSSAAGLARSATSSFPNSIAVLPFAHLSRDADDEYFCDGLAEELINALGKVNGLKVVARTSAFSFKDKNIDIAQIGSLLNVQNIVEGSVRKFGERMRISVQLINADDGYHIWSDKYDTELRDIFDVQDEITAAVVLALKSKLLGEAGAPPTEGKMAALIDDLKHHTRDLEAYQFYLRGRFFLNKFAPDEFANAVDCFEKAIGIEPSYAEAYAGLADAHMLSSELGAVPPQKGMPLAKAAALRAIELNPRSSESHVSLGFVQQDFEYNFTAAEASYRRAIELNPNNSTAHAFYGGLLAQLGRHVEAEKALRKALALDPLSPMGQWVYALALFLGRRYDESLERSRETLELDPNYPAAYLTLSFGYQMKEQFAESVDAYAKFLEMCSLPTVAAACRSAFETAGWQGFLRAIISPESAPTVTAYIIAVYQSALGEHSAALASLERSLAAREPHIVMLKVDPRFDEIRGDARFNKLLAEIRFPD
jgi:serine/threonine-protein kinase